MSRYWKPSRNGLNDFEDVYRDYRAGKISHTEAAYHLGISTTGFSKRIRTYEKDHSLRYDKTTKEEKEQALKLMEKHIDKIKKFNIKYQDKLTDVLYRTCLYIIRNYDDIENESNLVWFSLRRKVRDLSYQEYKRNEKLILDKPSELGYKR